MTLMQLFGAIGIAYGPGMALFVLTIAPEPLRIIVMIAGMFFWLLALLMSSIWWTIFVGLQHKIVFGMTFSVLFQELFRYFYYLILRKAEAGLQQFSQTEEERRSSSTDSVVSDKKKREYAYVAGLGFGIMSGLIGLINILADSKGPGTVGINDGPGNFLLTSSILTCCMTMLHVVWNVVFYWGFETNKFLAPILVVLSHFLVSEMTLLDDPYNAISIAVAFANLAVFSIFAFLIAGGSPRGILAAFTCRKQRYNL